MIRQRESYPIIDYSRLFMYINEQLLKLNIFTNILREGTKTVRLVKKMFVEEKIVRERSKKGGWV